MVTDVELTSLQALADAEGTSISTYVHRILARALKRRESSTKHKHLNRS